MADSGQGPALYEVGGSVIHPRNRLMLELVEKAGLKAKPTPKGFDPSEDTRSGGNKQLYFRKPVIWMEDKSMPLPLEGWYNHPLFHLFHSVLSN